jgi:hypothetical protein
MVWPTARPATLVTLMLLPLVNAAARVVVAAGVSVQLFGRKMSACPMESLKRMRMSL